MEVKLTQFDVRICSGIFTAHSAFDQFFSSIKIIQCDEHIVVHVEDHFGLVLLPDLIEVELGLLIGAFVVIKLCEFQIGLTPNSSCGHQYRCNEDPSFFHVRIYDKWRSFNGTTFEDELGQSAAQLSLKAVALRLNPFHSLYSAGGV